MLKLTEFKNIRIYHDAIIQGEVEEMSKDGEDMMVYIRVKGAFPKSKPVQVVNNQLDMFKD